MKYFIKKEFRKYLFPLSAIILALSFQIGIAVTTTFSNPAKVDDMAGLLESVQTYFSGFIVGLAILFVVLGGILYMLSAGDPAMVKRAKNCWMFSFIGFAIVASAPTLLSQIVDILGGADKVNTGTPIALEQIVANVLNLLLSVLGMLCIISLTVAGGMYMTAYGDDKRVETAKKIAQYSIIGLVVALSSLVVITQIETLISG
jgi:hypothetical protein